ncbi:UPF0158 family protein [Micromonospora sp. NPDC050495]|uniref:UPF0158 family protein n=1 Tax=Micromonospora sp. NPDC050495 TaxID=3154936 RepID=UPI0033E9118B
MRDPDDFDLEAIATALEDQSAYEHRWLIDPATAEVLLWTVDGGIDGQTPVDLEELDLVPIDPVPSHVWHGDMADFADRLGDERAGRRLRRAIEGRGAFRRFRNELYEEYPHLVSVWQGFHQARALRRAIDFLADNRLIAEEAAEGARAEHPDPPVP